jgi:hypothetical protein
VLYLFSVLHHLGRHRQTHLTQTPFISQENGANSLSLFIRENSSMQMQMQVVIRSPYATVLKRSKTQMQNHPLMNRQKALVKAPSPINGQKKTQACSS